MESKAQKNKHNSDRDQSQSSGREDRLSALENGSQNQTSETELRRELGPLTEQGVSKERPWSKWTGTSHKNQLQTKTFQCHKIRSEGMTDVQ